MAVGLSRLLARYPLLTGVVCKYIDALSGMNGSSKHIITVNSTVELFAAYVFCNNFQMRALSATSQRSGYAEDQ